MSTRKSKLSGLPDRGSPCNPLASGVFEPLPRSFFDRPTLDVARALLGTVLVRQLPDGILAARVVEVEAYIGEDDPACHASRGLTPRTEVMYGPPGHAYVYFTYGMHFMLNAVTEKQGIPAAVLFRSAEPLFGIETMRRHRGACPDHELTSGPARLCAAFGIDLRLNRADLTIPPFFIAKSIAPTVDPIRWTERIGVRNGGGRKWRCFLLANPFVSKARPGIPPPRRHR